SLEILLLCYIDSGNFPATYPIVSQLTTLAQQHPEVIEKLADHFSNAQKIWLYSEKELTQKIQINWPSFSTQLALLSARQNEIDAPLIESLLAMRVLYQTSGQMTRLSLVGQSKSYYDYLFKRGLNYDHPLRLLFYFLIQKAVDHATAKGSLPSADLYRAFSRL